MVGVTGSKDISKEKSDHTDVCRPPCGEHLQTLHQPKQGTWLSQGSKLQTMAGTQAGNYSCHFANHRPHQQNEANMRVPIFATPRGDTSFVDLQDAEWGLLEPDVLTESLLPHLINGDNIYLIGLIQDP